MCSGYEFETPRVRTELFATIYLDRVLSSPHLLGWSAMDILSCINIISGIMAVSNIQTGT